MTLQETDQLKIPPDYKKVNKTRRNRGYNLEYSLVNAFNNHHSQQWHARRLGGSSTGLPDIVSTNNEKSILYAIECKSGESNILYIPKDQIERCKEITDKLLRTYKNRYIVFAFKFKGSKKNKRKLQYRIIPWIGFDCVDSLKGVSYDIIKSEFTLHHNSMNKYRFPIITLSSIEEFVNWK